jgi:signal peptidase I
MKAAVDFGGGSAQSGGERRDGEAPMDEAGVECDSPRIQAEALQTDVGSRALTVSDKPREQADVKRHGLLQAFQSLLNIVVVALFLITFTVQPFRIPSASMEPTLLVGDFLLVDKQVGAEVAPRIFPPTDVIHRGDVIVFHYPVDSSLHLVKRVVGLPGDRIRLRDGHTWINGSPIAEPYAVFRPSVPDSYRDDFPQMVSADPGVDSRWWIQMRSLVAHGELTVPPDSYFVLGDNRNDSEDSRYWGFVPRAAIVGKPLLVYFSLNEPSSMPGQTASALPGNGAMEPGSPADSVIDFARWDRSLHIIH